MPTTAPSDLRMSWRRDIPAGWPLRISRRTSAVSACDSWARVSFQFPIGLQREVQALPRQGPGVPGAAEERAQEGDGETGTTHDGEQHHARLAVARAG